MFGLSFSHMILLSALALIFIGPKQLPEVARQIGKFLNELKRMGGDVSKTITDARNTTDDHLRQQNVEIPPEPVAPDQDSVNTSIQTTKAEHAKQD